MKNYLSKLENIIVKDHFLRFKKKNPFGTIISLIALIFILSLYFTIPTFYNYKNFENEIQSKVSKDFKLNLKNISGFTYLMLPSPHFLIEECDIYFVNNPNEKILKAKHLKINIFSKNLHKKEKIEFKSIYLNKVDLDLKFADIKNFYKHLKSNITKPIYINNANIFFRDENQNIISISKIKNFEYFIDFKKKEKKLFILGNLFGSNFKFNWKKNFTDNYESTSNIKFKNPKLNITNKFSSENEAFTVADTSLKFLKNNFDFKYKFNEDSIEFFNDNKKIINTSKVIGNINLNPFFFDLNLILSGVRIQTLLNNLFLNLYKNNKSSKLNFNGNLKINLDEINNRLFEKLVINISFLDEKISLKNSSLILKKIGKINFSDPLIYEKNQKIFIKSKIRFDVKDQQELYKRFLIPRQNRINLDKVYFELEYNVEEGNFYLSNINLNENVNKELIFQEINNIQQLNSLISSEFKKINLE
tara:strand:- start:64 stop:1488 length:1425 start_codon:yes stop_codon:yes gene_type:complete